MPRLLNADDILPLVASLTLREKAPLLRLITSERESDASVYAARPPWPDDFQADDPDLLSWDSEGWEQFN